MPGLVIVRAAGIGASFESRRSLSKMSSERARSSSASAKVAGEGARPSGLSRRNSASSLPVRASWISAPSSSKAARALRKSASARRQHAAHVRAGGEERAAREHLGEDDARGEEVDAVVDGLPHELLGGHVPELAAVLPGDHHGLEARAGDRARGGGGARAGLEGDAEVAELHVARHREEDVGGGDVAVDEPVAVGAAEAVDVRDAREELAHDVAREGRLHAAHGVLERALDAPQVDAVDVLQDDVGLGVVVPGVHDGDDVGVGGGAAEGALPTHELAPGGVRAVLVREELEHHLGVVGRPGEEDLPHAADREPLLEGVPAELCSLCSHRHAGR